LRVTTRKAAFAGLTTVALVSLLAGCGAAPEASDSPNGTANSDFLSCVVSDSGGFDDKSFNQSALEGMVEAAATLGSEYKQVESKTDTDYAPNIDNMIDQGCGLIVTIGYLLAAATEEAAAANPDVNFAIIDDNSIDLPNVKHLVYNTAEAAFLAGYAAASYSTTKIVGVYGGLPIPPVTIFLDGFVQGVEYYNEQKGESVEVKGWDVEAQNGSFIGGFAAGTESKQAAQTLIDAGADVLLPAGGPIFLSAAEAIRDSSKPIALIGVDADLFLTNPENSDLFLTSIMKGIAPGVTEITVAAGGGEFDGAPYVGTLENNGVGIAPFHDFESKISPDLEAELDAIKADIISGAITVESPSSP